MELFMELKNNEKIQEHASKVDMEIYGKIKRTFVEAPFIARFIEVYEPHHYKKKCIIAYPVINVPIGYKKGNEKYTARDIGLFHEYMLIGKGGIQIHIKESSLFEEEYIGEYPVGVKCVTICQHEGIEYKINIGKYEYKFTRYFSPNEIFQRLCEGKYNVAKPWKCLTYNYEFMNRMYKNILGELGVSDTMKSLGYFVNSGCRLLKYNQDIKVKVVSVTRQEKERLMHFGNLAFEIVFFHMPVIEIDILMQFYDKNNHPILTHNFVWNELNDRKMKSIKKGISLRNVKKLIQ